MNLKVNPIQSSAVLLKTLLSLIWAASCLLTLTGCTAASESTEVNQISDTRAPASGTAQPSRTLPPATATAAPTRTPEPTRTLYPSSTPQEATLTVCEMGCDFQLLQTALDAPGTVEGVVIRILDPVHTEAGIEVSKSVIIQGAGPERSILQAHAQSEQARDRVFLIAEGAVVTIRDLVIQKGHPDRAPYTGGGILNFGNLTIENCLIQNNLAGDAGGIQNRGDLVLIDSIISDNTADGIGDPGMECGKGGGVVNAFQMTLTMYNSTISDNQAAGKGGGLHVACEGEATLVHSIIRANQAGRNGGGVFLKGTLTLIESEITRNSTPAEGGGVMIYGLLNYYDSAISGNISGGNCIIWGDDSYRGQGEVGIAENLRIPDNNCHH